MKVATAEQMQRLDRKAIGLRKIPSTHLMDEAAKAVAQAVLALLKKPFGAARVAVFCGPGNNGGDGIGAARHLGMQGVEVRTFLAGSRSRMTEDTAEMERRLQEIGGAVEPFEPEDMKAALWCEGADVIVDAVCGIGLKLEVREPARSAIARMNECPAPVVAADIASGVEADTGRVLGTAVKAAVTVTFTLPKAGHFVGDGGLCRGRLVIGQIGIPGDLIDEETFDTFAMTAEDVLEALPQRRPDGHKGTFGKVAIAAGSVGFTGAPAFSARSAVRAGAGLVFLYVPEPIYEVEAVKNDEAMVFPLPAAGDVVSKSAADVFLRRAEACDAVLAGPGLGRGPGTRRLVAALLRYCKAPLVLDADGLNELGGNIDKWRRQASPLILTPHDGEFARLGGDLSSRDRIFAAREFAKARRCVLVLKGHCTVTALPDGTVYLNTTGNSGMAKGGSGDVLSGIILALLGQKLAPGLAAAVAVWLHGRAGDLCAGRLGEYGMMPGDMVLAIPEAILSLKEPTKPEL